MRLSSTGEGGSSHVGCARPLARKLECIVGLPHTRNLSGPPRNIKAYLEREQLNVLPKSPEGRAIAYTLLNWKALRCYCEDGDLAIDNNGAERSLRGIAVGRRNWMFYESDNGGLTAALLTSLITTCKKLGIDPFAYLRDIFERISTHPSSQLEELLPDEWLSARRKVSTAYEET
jgi:transposase